MENNISLGKYHPLPEGYSSASEFINDGGLLLPEPGDPLINVKPCICDMLVEKSRLAGPLDDNTGLVTSGTEHQFNDTWSSNKLNKAQNQSFMSELCKCLNGEPNSICMFHGATDAASGGPCFDDRARLNRVPGMKLVVGVHNRFPSFLDAILQECECLQHGWYPTQGFFEDAVHMPFVPGIGALPTSMKILGEYTPGNGIIRRSAVTTAIADAFDHSIGYCVTSNSKREVPEDWIDIGSLASSSEEACSQSSSTSSEEDKEKSITAAQPSMAAALVSDLDTLWFCSDTSTPWGDSSNTEQLNVRTKSSWMMLDTEVNKTMYRGDTLHDWAASTALHVAQGTDGYTIPSDPTFYDSGLVIDPSSDPDGHGNIEVEKSSTGINWDDEEEASWAPGVDHVPQFVDGKNESSYTECAVHFKLYYAASSSSSSFTKVNSTSTISVTAVGTGGVVWHYVFKIVSWISESSSGTGSYGEAFASKLEASMQGQGQSLVIQPNTELPTGADDPYAKDIPCGGKASRFLDSSKSEATIVEMDCKYVDAQNEVDGERSPESWTYTGLLTSSQRSSMANIGKARFDFVKDNWPRDLDFGPDTGWKVTSVNASVPNGGGFSSSSSSGHYVVCIYAKPEDGSPQRFKDKPNRRHNVTPYTIDDWQQWDKWPGDDEIAVDDSEVEFNDKDSVDWSTMPGSMQEIFNDAVNNNDSDYDGPDAGWGSSDDYGSDPVIDEYESSHSGDHVYSTGSLDIKLVRTVENITAFRFKRSPIVFGQWVCNTLKMM